jgi:hypothetical protein
MSNALPNYVKYVCCSTRHIKEYYNQLIKHQYKLQRENIESIIKFVFIFPSDKLRYERFVIWMGFQVHKNAFVIVKLSLPPTKHQPWIKEWRCGSIYSSPQYSIKVSHQLRNVSDYLPGYAWGRCWSVSLLRYVLYIVYKFIQTISKTVIFVSSFRRFRGHQIEKGYQLVAIEPEYVSNRSRSFSRYCCVELYWGKKYLDFYYY